MARRFTQTFILLMVLGITRGTGQVPSLVHDIVSGLGSSGPARLTAWKGRLFLYALDAKSGNELREYNGIDSPKLVYDLYAGKGSSASQYDDESMLVFNDKLYFAASSLAIGQTISKPREIFVYDGTNPPTIAPALHPAGHTTAREMVTTGGKIYFTAIDTLTNATTFLFSTNGVSTPIRYPFPSANYSELTACNGKVYFQADTPTKGNELYVYDPVTSYNGRVHDLNAASSFAAGPRGLITAFNKLYFSAWSSNTSKAHLFSYDGIIIKRLTGIGQGDSLIIGPTSNKGSLAYYDGAIYFGGSKDGSVRSDLFKWDTATGLTKRIHTLSIGADAQICNLFVFDNNLYFIAKTAGAGRELWKWDGTLCGIVANLNAGAADGMNTSEFAIYNNALYFAANNGLTGIELYRLNARANGIEAVNWDGTASLYPNPVTADAALEINIKRAEKLSISIVDISGREVYRSGLQILSSGRHLVAFSMQYVAAGQYGYRLLSEQGICLASGIVVKQ